MKRDDTLNRIGKRMPYTVPPGFFEEMERNIRQEALSPPTVIHPARRRLRLTTTIGITTAAAGIAAMLFLTHPIEVKPTGKPETIEQAFANLSEEDQTYMLETYQEDIFINQ